MQKSLFWTKSRARLQWVRSSGQGSLNWLFLPGGPGLGSESLLPLLSILKLPGHLWRVDLPGDGSNTINASFSRWTSALTEAVSEFKHVILVAHSTGGMYALSLPELENLLEGLILLDSAPDSGWQTVFAETVRNLPVPGIEVLQEEHRKSPSNQTLKALTVASAPYLFTEEGQKVGKEMLSSLPYNNEACRWSEEHFDSSYQAKWVPKELPTLIMAGEKDLLTPLRLFKEVPQFQRRNIVFKSIASAGHFPWIENPKAVIEAFNEYENKLAPRLWLKQTYFLEIFSARKRATTLEMRNRFLGNST